MYKRQSYVIRVWKTFSFASGLPPFPIERASPISSFQISASPVTDLNSYQTDVCGTCTVVVLNRTDRSRLTSRGRAVDTNSSKKGADRLGDVVYKVTQHSQRDDGLHSERSKLIFPPGSISSHYLPLTPPCPPSIPWVIQYAQTEPFLPSSSIWHHMFFEKVKRTQI